MSRWVVAILGLGLLLGTGLVHGWWTQRWQRRPALATAIARLERVPGDIGSWHAEQGHLPPEHLVRAGAEGYRLAKYTSPQSESSFSMILLCGAPGPLSVHRPEHCYPGAGYYLKGVPVHYLLRSPGGEPLGSFYTGRFVKEDVTGATELRIFWSWYDGHSWRAPEYPRWTFAPLPYLYKLYIIRQSHRSYPSMEEDPSVHFLQELLPRLSQALKEPT